MNALALTLAFLLELVAVAYFAAISFTIHFGRPLQIILSIALLGALVTFWSIFMAPRATKRFTLLPYYCAKAAIYTVSAVAMYQLTSPQWLWIFVILAVLDEVFLFKRNLQKPSHK